MCKARTRMMRVTPMDWKCRAAARSSEAVSVLSVSSTACDTEEAEFC